MARYIHLKIYRDSFNLFIEYNKIFPNFSKKYKYPLCQEVQKLLLENFRLIIKINRLKEISNKKVLIEELILNLEQLNVLFRSLSFLKEISNNYYLKISQDLLEIIKQSEGWFKYYDGSYSSVGGGHKFIIQNFLNIFIPEFIWILYFF